MKVNEIFLSVQGEGMNTGFPTIFIRFTGCNLRCSYCDTTYSYEEGAIMSIEEIMARVNELKYKRVCLTGGEPLIQDDILKLLEALKDYEVSIETNGAVSVKKLALLDKHTLTMDMKTPSSGESEKMCFENLNCLRKNDEIKFVVGNREDYEWTKEILKRHYKNGIVHMSAIFGKIEPREIIEWILEDKLDIRFNLQIHKVIWNPQERGV